MPDRGSAGARVATKLASRTAVHVGSPVFARYRRVRSAGKPRVLVYADSRATNVIGPLGKSVFGTYAARLMRHYRVYPIILPRPHTTLVDFLNHAHRDRQTYDAVLLHCGIVDFSPRPVTSIAGIAAAKSRDPGFDKLFADNAAYHREAHGAPYDGVPTTTLYSPSYLEDVLVPRLAAIPNLVWITTNDFVPGWEGNYTRGRPVDIAARIAEFETRLRPTLQHVIDMHTWSYDDVQRFTIDNVHYSRAGVDEMAQTLRSGLDQVLGQSVLANHPGGNAGGERRAGKV
jgi:hypothetical protein